MVRKTRKNNRKKIKNRRLRNRTKRRLKKLKMKGGAPGFLDFFNIFKNVEKKADPEKKIDEVNKGFLNVLEGRVKGLFQRQQKQLDETREGILSQIKTAVNTVSKEAKKAVGSESSELTIPFLEKVLTKYFNNNTQKVSELISFIKSNLVNNKEKEKENDENKKLKNMIDGIKPNKNNDEKKDDEKKDDEKKDDEKKDDEKKDDEKKDDEKKDDEKKEDDKENDDKEDGDTSISIEEVNLEMDDTLLKDD